MLRMRYRLPVAPDGWRFVVPLAILTVVGWRFGGLIAGLPLTVLTAFTLYFFRDPERELPAGDNLAVAPADGKILSIEKVECERFPQGQALKVGIFLSVFDVHLNRCPADGTVQSVRHTPGRFHNALLEKSSEENEHNVIALDTRWGYMEVKQIAGVIARRIVCYCRTGSAVKRGERIGLIRFGSRTEVYLPLGTEIWVRKGDRVRGGATPLGRLAENEKRS